MKELMVIKKDIEDNKYSKDGRSVERRSILEKIEKHMKEKFNNS